MEKLAVFDTPYHVGVECDHDQVRLSPHDEDLHDGTCEACDYPVSFVLGRRPSFLALYERREHHRLGFFERVWNPMCPDCGAPCEVEVCGQRWASSARLFRLVCTNEDGDGECRDGGWSDTLIGLRELDEKADR